MTIYELEIEALVLEGVAAHDREQVATAMQRELTRLLQGGLPLKQDVQVARLDGGQFRLVAGMRAEAIGKAVAQSIYGGLQNGSKNTRTG